MFNTLHILNLFSFTCCNISVILTGECEVLESTCLLFTPPWWQIEGRVISRMCLARACFPSSWAELLETPTILKIACNLLEDDPKTKMVCYCFFLCIVDSNILTITSIQCRIFTILELVFLQNCVGTSYASGMLLMSNYYKTRFIYLIYITCLAFREDLFVILRYLGCSRKGYALEMTFSSMVMCRLPPPPCVHIKRPLLLQRLILSP